MLYVKKYNKYRIKNMKGGVYTIDDILRLKDDIDISLGFDNWCFTGSTAIYMYCLQYGIVYDLIPNDLDIVVVRDINERQNPKPLNIGKYYRDSNADSDNGIEYKYNNKKIDLICSEKIEYVNVPFNGIIIRLISPIILKDNYGELYEDLESMTTTINEDRYNIDDDYKDTIDKTIKKMEIVRYKLNILDNIIEYLEQNNIDTEIYKDEIESEYDSKPRFDIDQNFANKSLFGDDD